MDQGEKEIITYCKQIEAQGRLQGTPEWVEHKRGRLGGTAAGYFTGAPFKKLYDLIAERGGLADNKSQAYIMNFGSLFEELIKRLAEHDLGTVIYGENIYVEYDNTIAYSPDGLAHIDTSLFSGPNVGKQKCLLEFKCPFSRYPNGKVPEDYVAQQLLGMDVCKLKYSLYLEAVFRRCTIAQLGPNNVYDHELNIFQKIQPIMTNVPIAWGIIGFTCPQSWPDANAELLTICKTTMDLGKLDLCHMKKFIEATATGIFVPMYQDILYGDHDRDWKATLKLQVAQCISSAGNDFVGVLPYKIFRRDYHWVNAQEGFISKHHTAMESAMNCIREMQSTKSKVKKLSIISSYFDAITYTPDN